APQFMRKYQCFQGFWIMTGHSRPPKTAYSEFSTIWGSNQAELRPPSAERLRFSARCVNIAEAPDRTGIPPWVGPEQVRSANSLYAGSVGLRVVSWSGLKPASCLMS